MGIVAHPRTGLFGESDTGSFGHREMPLMAKEGVVSRCVDQTAEAAWQALLNNSGYDIHSEAFAKNYATHLLEHAKQDGMEGRASTGETIHFLPRPSVSILVSPWPTLAEPVLPVWDPDFRVGLAEHLKTLAPDADTSPDVVEVALELDAVLLHTGSYETTESNCFLDAQGVLHWVLGDEVVRDRRDEGDDAPRRFFRAGGILGRLHQALSIADFVYRSRDFDRLRFAVAARGTRGSTLTSFSPRCTAKCSASRGKHQCCRHEHVLIWQSAELGNNIDELVITAGLRFGGAWQIEKDLYSDGSGSFDWQGFTEPWDIR